MIQQKYYLTLRNFNLDIINIVLKANGYYNIEEYELETNNNIKFGLLVDIESNHIIHENTDANIRDANIKSMHVPLSYLTTETKHYLYTKYMIKMGFISFDEYFIYFNNSLPNILISIPIFNRIQSHNKNSTHNQKNNTHNQIYDELFEIEPLIDFSNLYGKIIKNKLLIRAYNLELDRKSRSNHYIKKTWNIFDTVIKYNRREKAWIFPLELKDKLVNYGVHLI